MAIPRPEVDVDALTTPKATEEAIETAREHVTAAVEQQINTWINRDC